MNSLILSVLLFSMTNVAFAQAPTQEAGNLTEGEKSIINFLNAYDEAIITRDLKKLEAYLSKDFMMISPIGSVMTRAQILMPFQPNVENRSALIAIETTNFQIKTYEGSAVATAITSHKFKESTNRPVSKYRNTYSLVQKDGQWQIAAIHIFKFNN